jgi:hypothetical protein
LGRRASGGDQSWAAVRAVFLCLDGAVNRALRSAAAGRLGRCAVRVHDFQLEASGGCRRTRHRQAGPCALPDASVHSAHHHRPAGVMAGLLSAVLLLKVSVSESWNDTLAHQSGECIIRVWILARYDIVRRTFTYDVVCTPYDIVCQTYDVGFNIAPTISYVLVVVRYYIRYCTYDIVRLSTS